jgi:hypothetical protein
MVEHVLKPISLPLSIDEPLTSKNETQIDMVSVLRFCFQTTFIKGSNQFHKTSCFFNGQCFEPGVEELAKSSVTRGQLAIEDSCAELRRCSLLVFVFIIK